MVTIVSGLPRSGTSLVMQMLAAGGLPVLCDDQRPADDDNPRGYLEDQRVRRLDRDATWMHEADGKALKVVSPLLKHLPAGFEYRILFVRRDLDEVLESQSRMLERRGEPAGPPPQTMRRYFEDHLNQVSAWLSEQSAMRTLPCDYAVILRDPQAAAQRIQEFIEIPLDLAGMASAVVPALHRQRSAAR